MHRITIVHAHARTALARVTAGRVDELADYLADFVTDVETTDLHFALGHIRGVGANVARERQADLAQAAYEGVAGC